MKSISIVLAVLAAATGAQITVTPTTICHGDICTSPGATDTCAETTRTVFIPTTETATATTTETSVVTQVASVTATLVETTTVVRTQTQTQTQTQTTTVRDCGAAPSCPTLTSTGTVCRTCLTADCATTQVVTRSCGCPAALATATTDFPCNGRDSCDRVGCSTVYLVQTQRS